VWSGDVNDVRSILLVHTGALGDFVLSVALLRLIAAVFPGAGVSALCRNRIACYFANHGVLAGWKSLESAKFTPLFSADMSLCDASREYLQSFDVIVSMLGGPADRVSQRLCEHAAGEVFCIDPNARAETEQQGRHIVRQWVDDLREQGMSVDAADLLVGQEGRVRSDAGYVLIHPGSGGRSKCWALQRFEALAQELQAMGRQVRFMVGPVEMDLFGDDLRARLSYIAPVIYEEDVCDAAEQVASASAFVGNDAGMTHLAAFVGIPTVAIFTATICNVWRPIGRDVRVVDARQQGGESAELIARMVCESRR